MPLPFEPLTAQILAAAFEVSGELGVGFVESVYEGAMFLALKSRGLEVARQVPIKVHFKGELVGHFIADLVVNDTVVVELKAVKVLLSEHHAQVLNYLKATGKPVSLLINFGNPKLEFRRFDHRFEKSESEQG